MRVPRQAWVLGLAAALWTLGGDADLASLVIAYLAALSVVWAVVAWRPRALDLRLSPTALVLLALAVAGPAVSAALRRTPAIAENETLLGLGEHLGDRWAYERKPAIAPPVVFTDRPQRFYIHAPGARSVRLEGEGIARPPQAEGLGHGLFRVDYDPATHGILAADAVGLAVDEDTHEREVERVVPTAHPRRLRANPSRTLAAAVSAETDELLVVDGSGFVGAHQTPDRPRDLAFLDDDTVAVASAAGVTLVNARTGDTLAHHPRPAVTAVARAEGAPLAPETLLVGIGGPSPGLIALSDTLTESRRVADLPEAPDALVCTPIACVAALRRAASLVVLGDERGELRLGRPAVTLAALDEGTVAVAVTDYSPGEPHLGNHFVQDQVLTLDLEERAITARRPTAWRSPRQAAAGDLDRGLSPMAIDGHRGTMAIAFAGSDEVEVFRPGVPVPSVVDLGATPLFAPQGVVRLADGALVVASPGAGAVGVFREGELDTLVQLEDPADHTPAQALRVRGEHSFFEGTRSGVSCQSCHLHADTDHVLRNIGGRRLAPTLTVRGIAGTAPYLRDGSYPRIADLTHLSTTLLGGWLRREPGRGEALDAYVRALPRPQPEALDAEAARAGLDVYVDAGCPACHGFPAFTSLGSVPAAALFPEQRTLAADERLDVPSLLSVGARGPFLADGRAPTLRSVFDEPGGRHGDTEGLSDTELDRLVRFLESL